MFLRETKGIWLFSDVSKKTSRGRNSYIANGSCKSFFSPKNIMFLAVLFVQEDDKKRGRKEFTAAAAFSCMTWFQETEKCVKQRPERPGTAIESQAFSLPKNTQREEKQDSWKTEQRQSSRPRNRRRMKLSWWLMTIVKVNFGREQCVTHFTPSFLSLSLQFYTLYFLCILFLLDSFLDFLVTLSSSLCPLRCL